MRHLFLFVLACPLFAAAPSFVTALPDEVLAIDPITGTVTYGIQAQDLDGDPVTLSATSSHPGVQATVSSTNRYARLNVVDSSGTPIGPIVFELFESRGGEAASRFITHATANPDGPDTWYTDSPFHRVAELPGLILQAGHSAAGATGSSLGNFDDQFDLQEGLNFSQKGVVAMANSGANTNNSQFFITDGATTHLDGIHMIFGQVISGQSVITTIGNLPRDGASRPLPTPRIASVDILDNVNGGALTIRVLPGFAGDATITVTVEDDQGQRSDHIIQVHVPMTVLAQIAATSGTTFHSVRDANGVLYVANGSRGLDLWDTSIPENPVFLRNLDTAGSARHVTLSATIDPPRTIAIVSDSDNGLITFDVSNPALATQLDHVPVAAGGGALNGTTYMSEVQDDLLYVAEGEGGFSIFDFSDPSAIVGPLGSLDLTLSGGDGSVVPANIVALAINGTTAYASIQNFGLIAIAIDNPGTPLLAANDGFGSAWGMALDNGRLYVTQVAASGALRVYDMFNPRSFQNQLGTHPLVGYPWQVDAHGDLVVVAHSPVQPSFPTGGFSVLDISDPGGIGTHFFHTTNSAVHPTIDDDYVILPLANEGLLFSDLRVLNNPEISMTVDGDFILTGAAIDFGQLGEGTIPAERSLRIYNDGPQPLTLNNLILPNGFSQIGAPPPTLLPDTWADLSIRLNTGVAGDFSGQLQLQSDDPSEPTFRLNLTGSIIGSATISGHLHTEDGVTNPPLANIEMTLQPIAGGAAVTPVNSDAQGNFTFSHLVSGTYRLKPTVPGNYEHADPNERLISLNPLNTISDANFAMLPTPATVSGFIWNDADADGIVDESEAPLSGILVSLKDGDDIAASQATGTDGRYTFTGLAAGTYTLSAANIPGMFSSTRLNPRELTLDWGDALQFADFNYFTPPLLTVGQPTVSEEAGYVDIPLTLSFDIGLPVIAEFATGESSALAGQDFTHTSGSVTLAPRETSTTIRVELLDDGIAELAETFQLLITDLQNANTAGATDVTITDSDRVRFSITSNDSLVNEGGSPGIVQVDRIGALVAPITVDLIISGTAEGADYAAIPTTLTFNTNEHEKLIDIDAIADGLSEGDETVTITLQRHPDHVVLADSATVTIADSDGIDLSINLPQNAQNLVAGNALPLSFTAINLLDNAVVNSIDFAVHLSVDEIFGNDDDIPLDVLADSFTIPSLAADSSLPVSVRLTIPVDTAAGDYRLIARIDASDSYAETVESNNTSATAAVISITADSDGWRFPFRISGAPYDEIRMGMSTNAQAGPDDFDQIVVSRSAFPRFTVAPLSYVQDIRPLADSASWTLALLAGAEELVVTWNVADMPADRGFYVINDANGEINYFMHLNELRVPANSEASYTIEVVRVESTQVTVAKGWNLLSLPIAPVASAPEDVLGTATSPVHHWRDNSWMPTDIITALDGIWAYARRSHSATITGMPSYSTSLDLAPGWHAIGPIIGMSAVGDIAWEWTGTHFTVAESMVPGRGYLVYTENGIQTHLLP